MTTVSPVFASERPSDLGATLLRVTSGVLFLIHGGLKLFVFTPAGTAGYFQSLGLPGFAAYLVIALEVLGGLALLVGFQTRIVAVLLALDLLGAAWFGHVSNGFFFSNPNGGWEYPVFWAIVMGAQALLGAGAYSIDKR